MTEWYDRTDFSEVTSPLKVKELFADRLRALSPASREYEVSIDQFDEDTGKGRVSVNLGGDTTVIPFRLPEDEERLFRIVGTVLRTEGEWNSPHKAQRHGRHKEELSNGTNV